VGGHFTRAYKALPGHKLSLGGAAFTPPCRASALNDVLPETVAT
jgi:hypothetical protein